MNRTHNYETSNAQLLVGFINSHGIEAHELNGHLFAHSIAHDATVNQTYVRIEEVTPTLAAVREFLGY